MRRLVVVFVIAGLAGVLWLLRSGGDATSKDAAPPLQARDADALPAFSRDLGMAAQASVPVEMTQTATASDASVFEARVHHADGAPATGSIGVLAHGDDVVWRAFADSVGRLRGEASDGAATLWVGGATLDPVPFELVSARGSQEFTLPAGEVIDGRVTVDGGTPPEPFFLQIEGGPRTSQPDPPEAVSEAIQPWRSGVSTGNITQGQLIGTEGSFHFSGLPAGWSGAFVPEYGWYLDNYDDQAVLAPARGVLLALRRTPRLRLRVLAAGTREPAGGAQVVANVHADQTSAGHTIVCGDDGRAVMPLLRWESAYSVALDVANAAGTERRVLVVPIADASHDVDLGDVELQRSRDIAFRVRSSTGQPVAGARAYLEGERTEYSPLTGADGLGHLDNVAPGCDRMRVVAERFEPVSVELPPQSPPEPIDVTLPGCASIEVQIASSDGAARDGLSLFWIAPRTSRTDEARSEIYRRALMRGAGLGGDVGAEFHWKANADGTSSCDAYATVPAHTGGPYRLGCLAADVPIDVHLLDRTGFALWSQTGVRLVPGETRELPALISAAPWTASVLVTDVAGAPLADTSVDVFNTEGKVSRFAYPERSAKTGADGRVELAPIYAPSVSLYVEHEDLSPVRVEGVVPGAETHVVLLRGVSVRLSIVDSVGQPVPIDSPWVRDARDRYVGADEEGLDEVDRTMFLGNDVHAVWQLSNLPPDSDVVVAMRVGGREMSFPLSTSTPEATITLPAAGSVTVKQPEEARRLVKLSVALNDTGDESRSLSEDLRTDGNALRDIELPFVFPGDYRVLLRGEMPESHAVVRFQGRVSVEAGKNSVVMPLRGS